MVPAESQANVNKDSVGSSTKVSQSTIESIIANQTPFKAGGLQYFLHEWKKITSDPFILDAVTHCHIEFDWVPEALGGATRPCHSFTEAEQTIIDNEIEKFLLKGIIRLSLYEDGQVISPIFVRPKKDGSHRVIFNLKKLNEAVSYHHFKMDTLETAIKLMRPGCYMTSIDLKDAYYSIPIAPEHQKFLKFVWKDQLYAFNSLPMGLSSSPRIFTKILKPFFSALRSQFGHTCLGYIDDSFYLEDSYLECEEATLHAVQLFISLGFKIHPEKSVVIPTQVLEFLGFILNSILMTVTLTEKKAEKILQLCQKFSYPGRQFTIREVASFIGTLVSSFPGVEFGPLHYRHIEADKELNLKLSKGNFDSHMTLSHDSLKDVCWWSSNIQTATRKILHSSPDVVVYTDASQTGWGAHIDHGNNTCGVWSKSESLRHINYLELLAVKLALASLFDNRSNIHVRVMSDNTTTVSYINSMGGCKSRECNSITKDIWDWARERNIWLSAAHIPGSSNVDADQLSRNLNLNLEWMLSKPIFQRIVSLFGKPDIDLFASRLNAQVETYVSWRPQPMAKFVDAFSIEWSQFFFYAFPPFCLISRCVQKIIHDQASGILVIPRWTTQPFFTVVLSLLIDMPRVLKASAQNLIHPALDSPHPLHQRLELLVCKLSGNPCKTQRFRQTLLKLSCSPGETVHTNSTKCISTSGYSFVVKGHMIHCIPL